MDMLSFKLTTNLVFGPNTSLGLPETLLNWKARKVGVIVDIGLRQNPQIKELLKRLKETEFETLIEENTAVEPDYDYLDDFKSHFNPSYDILIGIGGGSTLDLTKAVSVLVTNPGPAIQYRGFDLIKNRGISVVAIPTTAGTGSEVTPNAVFTDKKEMRKLGINTSLYLPRLAILDPLMTLSCPKTISVSSGMDALVHTLESYGAKNANEISRMFSKQAFSLVFNNLPRVVKEPDNVKWRENMQLGAYYAGIALMNAGAGPTGALSYPLGVRFGVPHGLAGAVFLPHVIGFNISKGYTGYAELYDLIEGADPSLDVKEKSIRFHDMLKDLCQVLGIPESLEKFGVTKSNVEQLVRETKLLKGALEQNPIPFSDNEVQLVLNKMARA